MVNLELFNIVEEVKKVSNAFVVLPKNVNAENAASMVFSFLVLADFVIELVFSLAFIIGDSAVLPVMLSSKLLPEMEADDNSKREQLLQGVQSLPIPMQIERLKVSSVCNFSCGFLHFGFC